MISQLQSVSHCPALATAGRRMPLKAGGPNNDNLSGYGVLRQASGVERLAKCRVFAINPSDDEKRVIHSNPRRTFFVHGFICRSHACTAKDSVTSHEFRGAKFRTGSPLFRSWVLPFATRHSYLDTVSSTGAGPLADSPPWCAGGCYCQRIN